MKAKILRAIESERWYQEHKRPGHKHTIAEWLIVMEKCLNDAKRRWYSDGRGMDEIREVTACGVAAMEQHGAPERITRHSPPTKRRKNVEEDDL